MYDYYFNNNDMKIQYELYIFYSIYIYWDCFMKIKIVQKACS